jgi:hypothetical protein
MRYQYRTISGGEAGTDQTVEQIAEFVRYSQKRPHIRLLAVQILDRVNVDSREPKRAAHALFSWVSDRIKYVLDPISVETVQDPETTLKLKAGDCDDHSGLMAALLQSIGIPARFVVIGSDPDRFQHIYTEAQIKGEWIPVDTTLMKPFGSAGQLPVKKVYNIEGNEVMQLALGRTGVPLKRKHVQGEVFRETMRLLREEWTSGRMNRRDLKDYVKTLVSGRWAGGQTIANQPALNAAKIFLQNVERNNLVSSKPESYATSISGMDGFFGNLWNGVKKVVGGAVKVVTGGGEAPQVNITLPKGLVQTTVPVASAEAGARAGVMEILSSPYVLVGVGALILYMILKK